MTGSSRLELYIIALLISLSIVSCIDDEEVRLPTDVAVEGTEMFNTSFAVSEHLNLLLQPFESFTQYDADTLPIYGCPTVAVNMAERRVRLTFDRSTECPNNTLTRSGIISLYYTTSLINNEEIVLVEYTNYQVRNTRIEGSRLVTKRSGTLFSDTMARLMFYDEHESSTRLTAEYEHHLTIGSDSTLQITTTGSGGGRNLAGRSFNFTIENQKVQYARCIEVGINVPSMGRETWTFERTVTSAVTHRMNFGETSECDRNVSIVLSNGETLTLNP